MGSSILALAVPGPLRPSPRRRRGTGSGADLHQRATGGPMPANATSTLPTTPIAPGTYGLDPNHSGVHFQIRHLGLSNVRGAFKAFDAGLTVGDSLEDVTVTATI